MQRIIRLFACSLLLASAILKVDAHEPFDCSSRVTVTDNEIHVEVMMGLDGVRQFLPAAGFSPEQIKNIVLMRPSRNAIDLPARVAAELFELKLGGAVLTASGVKAHCDGLEVVFNLVYSRPTDGILSFRATYFETVRDMRSGVLVAADASRNQLGSSLLSPTSPSAQIRPPPLPVNASAGSISNPNTVSTGTDPGEPAPPQGASPPRISFAQFFRLGVEHILTGFDHLVFLAALLIGVRKPIDMLWVVTCFTVAHSITLAFAVLNVVSISPRIVEPMIAVSIVLAGIDSFRRKEAGTNCLWLAGGFGLIHGLGFAEALRNSVLGESGVSVALPLFSFNLGVEVGQLAVAAVLLLVLFSLRRMIFFERYGRPALSVTVILLGGFWLVQRVAFS
jgi:hydrogenase/urease accessory protein HupE